MNTTILESISTITVKSCHSWCEAQHYANDYKFMILLIVAFLCFTFHNLMSAYKTEAIEDEGFRKWHPFLTHYSKRLAYTLMLSFLLVWYMQTQYGWFS